MAQGNHFACGNFSSSGAVRTRESPKVIVKRTIFFNDENDVFDFVQALATLVMPMIIPIVRLRSDRIAG
jgi:hypothetical protein